MILTKAKRDRDGYIIQLARECEKTGEKWTYHSIAEEVRAMYGECSVPHAQKILNKAGLYSKWGKTK